MRLIAETARNIWEYNPETGLLLWKVDRGKVKPGDVAGTNNSGYLYVTYEYVTYPVHHIAFLIMTGRYPYETIDHKNNIRNDNRWENLREANRVQQNVNTKIQSNNKSGYRGVHWNKNTNKWRVTTTVNSKRIHLGVFDDKEEASRIYKEFMEKLHGDFSPNSYIKVNN